MLMTLACGYALIVLMIIGNAIRLSLLVQVFRDADKKNTHEVWHLPALSWSRKARLTLP